MSAENYILFVLLLFVGALIWMVVMVMRASSGDEDNGIGYYYCDEPDGTDEWDDDRDVS